MNKKIIITNYAALTAKYSKAGVTKIRARLAKMILGDNKRDLLTSVHDLGTASARYNLPALPPNAPPSQVKRAVDAVCKTETPEYLMILGSWDVVPPQKLGNPVFSPPDDTDAVVESDLPYACEKTYDDLIEQFVGPTRVVGRLPDIEGATEPSYLLELLDIAINWQGRDYADYIEYFGLSAKVWKKSTELSVYQTFGSIASLQLAPPGGPNWPLHNS